MEQTPEQYDLEGALRIAQLVTFHKEKDRTRGSHYGRPVTQHEIQYSGRYEDLEIAASREVRIDKSNLRDIYKLIVAKGEKVLAKFEYDNCLDKDRSKPEERIKELFEQAEFSQFTY